ncbi:MAG: type II toxin-antitoxin system RelE/ParE family toxin [Synergistaceae bacterium]|nr:type II toxin-antitoxin system RelE/ParE family toxin [Synergistaceae bacterium]
MSWKISYLPEALNDLKSLDGNQRILVQKAIKKVQSNPLSESEGGYGKPLGNKKGANLTNFLKIKLRSAGIRIVYKLERSVYGMLIVVIGIREDNEVYQDAQKRIDKHDLR